MLRKTPIAMAICSACGLPAAFDARADEEALPEITVTATRTERRVDDVPATVTVTTGSEIERSGARDIKDVFRSEIDVVVRAAPTRFSAAASATGRAGNEGINIRGLEGNQVLILVDGIRVPNAFSFGAFATGRGDFLDVDNARAIEVLRGPASTQYGSDGLAGAVSLRTWEPQDLLAKGQAAGGFVRSGYAQVDDSWHASAGVAGRSGDWQGLLVASYRRGHETDNQGANEAPDASRTAPNPVDYSAPALLGKLQYSLGSSQRFGVTIEAQRRSQQTNVLSAVALPPLAPTSTLALSTDDRVRRERVALEHRYDDPQAAWLQRAETRLYRQTADVHQFSDEDRNGADDRTRDNRYTQDVTGLATLLESRFGSAGIVQRLSYGFDWSRTEVEGVRDGSVPPFGETFPTKPFPDTRYTLAGAFVQDEIEAGAFSVIPAVRFDRYKLAPSAAGYSGGEVVTLSDEAVTPRIGVFWRADERFAPYAQWAEGFRAPTPDQVNNGFTNLAANYRSIGNPNLKAERAESIEIGVRGRLGGLRWSMAAFQNRYDDFISQQVVGGSGTPADPLVFQYVNLADARIRGVELRAEWRVDERWSLQGGTAMTRGRTRSAGVESPLDTIEPARTVLGLRYAAPSWGAGATLLHAQGQSASRVNPIPTFDGTTPAFMPPAYTVLDLAASWKPMPSLTLFASIDNVFDERYWAWSDVRGIAADSSVKDAYTAPGRNFRFSARYAF